MNLTEHYEEAIHIGEIVEDPEQKKVISSMQNLLLQLQKPRWFPWRRAVRGIYLYGPVGVGKTYLMDLLYQSLEGEKKARFHFHHFMQQVDAELRRVQGQKDPLQWIARNVAKQTRLLCFDEFLVHDVGTAMILAALLQALVHQGVVLLISSNTHPDELYLNGVQRSRFLPAIALLHQHCEILNLSSGRDYRLGHESLFNVYRYPLNEETKQNMEKQFALLGKDIQLNGLLVVQQREIPYLKLVARSIWFAFTVLCDLPRSSLDYLELASRFDVIFVSEVPCLSTAPSAQVILFIHFIDVMYDRGIQVILSAAVPITSLYEQGEMLGTFQRTLSRLIEMQAVDYLNRHPHRKTEYLRGY